MSRSIFTLVIFMFATALNAATATFTLSVDDNRGVSQPGAWTVYVDLTGDSHGLAAYYVDLDGINPITAAANLAPTATYRDSTGALPDLPAGFSFFRTVHYFSDASTWQIGASQDTLDYFSDPSSVDLIREMGSAAGTFSAHQPAGYDTISGAIQPTWAQHLAVATGTYSSGMTPGFSTSMHEPSGGANVFVDDNSYHTASANYQLVVAPRLTGIPEPASLGLMAIAAFGVAPRHRRRNVS